MKSEAVAQTSASIDAQPGEERRYTINQFAELMGVTRNVVEGWIKTGAVKSVREGRRYVIGMNE